MKKEENQVYNNIQDNNTDEQNKNTNLISEEVSNINSESGLEWKTGSEYEFI